MSEPWDWERTLREACAQAQRDGHRYRVFAIRTSRGRWVWTFRPATVKALRWTWVHAKWRRR